MKLTFTTFDKAIVGFLIASVAALMAEVNDGAIFDLKTVLFAVGTGLVTSGGVYLKNNKEN